MSGFLDRAPSFRRRTLPRRSTTSTPTHSMAAPVASPERLGDLLVREKLITRDQLEKDPLLEVTVGPTGPERFAPAAVGMVGGFSLRPTVRPTPSAFYDGTSWSTEPPAMLPLWPAGVTGAARYYVELRVVKQAFRRQTLTTYY